MFLSGGKGNKVNQLIKTQNPLIDQHFLHCVQAAETCMTILGLAFKLNVNLTWLLSVWAAMIFPQQQCLSTSTETLLSSVNSSPQNNLDGWLNGTTGNGRNMLAPVLHVPDLSYSCERHASSPFMFSSSCKDTPTSQILTVSKSPLMTTLHDFMSPCSSFFSLWRYCNEKQSVPHNHGLTPPFCVCFAFIVMLCCYAHLQNQKTTERRQIRIKHWCPHPLCLSKNNIRNTNQFSSLNYDSSRKKKKLSFESVPARAAGN